MEQLALEVSNESSTNGVQTRNDGFFSNTKWGRRASNGDAEFNGDSKKARRRERITNRFKKNMSLRKSRCKSLEESPTTQRGGAEFNGDLKTPRRRATLTNRFKKNMSLRKARCKSLEESPTDYFNSNDTTLLSSQKISSNSINSNDLTQRMELSESMELSAIKSNADANVDISKEEVSSMVGVENVDYEDAAPTRRRDSLGERVRKSITFRRRSSTASDREKVTNQGDGTASQYGYEQAAPLRRRSSIGQRIRIKRKSKAAKETGKKSERADSMESEASAAPKQGRRNSLTERIMFWTNVVSKEHSQKSSAEENVELRTQSSRRRSSLSDHILAWAGAVNQHRFNKDTGYKSHTDPRQYESNTGPRRASMDIISNLDGPDENFPILYPAATDDVDDRDNTSDSGGEYYITSDTGGRRNSLDPMVERAMATVNLESDDDELCAFGTRRDSLF